MTDRCDNVPDPVDASGELVPLDTRALVFDGERRSVVRYSYVPASRKWYVELAGINGGRNLTRCSLPDSWEKLERDIRDARDVKWALASCRYFGYDNVESCVDCPARGEDNCENAVFDDILRRAKALAGVSDGE